jgi:hypothetical protein
MASIPRVKSLKDFENSLNRQGNERLYEGLVESVGYVYWVPGTMYFEHENADKPLEHSRYREISSPWFASNRANVVSRDISVLHIKSGEELRKFNEGLYNIFYERERNARFLEQLEWREERERQRFFEPVSTRIETRTGFGSQGYLFETGSKMNDHLGVPTEIADWLTNDKSFGNSFTKWGGRTLAGLSIAHHWERGNYYDAVWESLLSVASLYGPAGAVIGVASVAEWVYKTPPVQRAAARGLADEHRKLRNDLNRVDRKINHLENIKNKNNRQHREMRGAQDERSQIMNRIGQIEKAFGNTMDRLGYQY